MNKLKSIEIKGFRSIKETTLHFHPLNVLIGANGAGKSNLIAFFKLLNELMAGRLQQHSRVYHFHDTSPTSRVRQYCYVGDNRWLMPDAANLAAILLKLKSHKETLYHRIVRTIRQVAPFFEDFDLEPTVSKEIILNWRHRSSDLVFGPHQLSDGTLRAICLISLLMQPKEDLPILIVVDEPELGLHPYTLNVIASLFRSASHHTQVLVSTQSSSFLDSFEPEDIIVVERNDEATEFYRPDAEELSSWQEEYSLGEIWEKNIIGGGPH